VTTTAALVAIAVLVVVALVLAVVLGIRDVRQNRDDD
jgi:hypothetical protein